MPGRDPLRYFRVEARELLEGLNQGVLDLERGGGPEAVRRLLRLAHTLKGAARVVRQTGLADLAHRLEEALGAGGDGHPPLPALAPLMAELARGVDALAGGRDAEPPPAASDPAAASAPASGAGPRSGAEVSGAVPGTPAPLPAVPEPPPAPPPARADTVRLETAELDAVLGALREAGVGLNACAEALAALPSEDARRAEAALERARRGLGQAHERAARLRLHPASGLFEYLERVARDAARALGRSLRFEAHGGDQRLDAAVLAALSGALQHLVRNAVVHGLEAPSERLALGKPAEGLLRLELARASGVLRVLVSDDGRGLRPEAVAKAAAARGLLPPGRAGRLDFAGAAALLLRGGLSTAGGLSELAGRGLGLEAARALAEGLGGRLELRARPGGGLEAELAVPDSLAALKTLALEAGGRRALLPFSAVRELFPLDARALVRAPEGGAIARPRGALPYLSLRRLLRGAEQDGAGGALPALGVVVACASGEAVLGADRVRGLDESVVQPVPDLAPRPRFLAGACLDGLGAAHPVLDPGGVVAEARLAPALPAAPGPPPAPLPLLVVDDSLTTRMLEQSILETAGYAVDLASSAEEGLARARARRYGVILVDVEMPGMDGFGFLDALAADPALAGVPAILVTSRDSPEDRRRAREAGARDYIVKGGFDQDRLLDRIRGLLA